MVLLNISAWPLIRENKSEQLSGVIYYQASNLNLLSYPRVYSLLYLLLHYSHSHLAYQSTGIMSQDKKYQTQILKFKQRFRTQRILGKGSFGAVYEVLDVQDNRIKALKIVSILCWLNDWRSVRGKLKWNKSHSLFNWDLKTLKLNFFL